MVVIFVDEEAVEGNLWVLKQEKGAVLAKETLERQHELEILEKFLHKQSYHLQHRQQLFLGLYLVADLLLDKRSLLHLQIVAGLSDFSIAEGGQVVEEEGADHDPGGSPD